MSVSLEGLTDQQLIKTLEQMVVKERKITHEIVLHFAEVDRRRLYAELGYTSLYDYATRGLRYSSSSAQRRIKAARILRKCPEVYDCLLGGSLTLSVLDVIPDALSITDTRKLLRDISGKNRDEALHVIACYFPVEQKRLSEKIEPVMVKKVSPAGWDELFKTDENNIYFRSEVNTKEVENDCELQFQLTFAVSSEVNDMLQRAMDITSSWSMEMTLEKVLEDFLKRRCPAKRDKRRKERARRREENLRRQAGRVADSARGPSAVADVIVPKMPEQDRDPANCRYPSAALRDEVLARDGHRCTFVAKDGTKCGATANLELDHIVPFAYGGKTTAKNLRTFCRAHNHLFEREVFGDDRVNWIIEQRRPGKDGSPQVYTPRWQICDPVEELLFG